MNPSQLNTTQLKEFVQLGQDAYADFSANAEKAALLASKNGPFAEGEVDQFLSRYGLVNQYTDPGINGFSATVFQDKDNPNRVVLSFRETEFNGDRWRDLILSDMQIGVDGYLHNSVTCELTITGEGSPVVVRRNSGNAKQNNIRGAA